MIKALVILIIMLTQGAYMDSHNIVNIFTQCNSITVIMDNTHTVFDKNSTEYTTLLDSLLDICVDSHEMPALGVSIDSETREAIKNNIWIELTYSNIITYNDMPFEKLLIEVNPSYNGFNIIRYINDEYTGRCFYLNLNKDMSTLYDTINNI